MDDDWDLAVLAGRVMAALPRCGSTRVLAIDGGAAAGKSTVAALLAAELPGSVVLHTDDLLDGWDDQFDFHHRLRELVLAPLATGRPGRYRRYDWVAGGFGDEVVVAVPEFLVVEGVSALYGCAGYSCLGIFVDVPRAVRERRWIERDGALQPEWQTWLDREDRYFAVHSLPGDTVVLRGV
jgi:uridine kinase